jgi:hypothetical protein
MDSGNSNDDQESNASSTRRQSGSSQKELNEDLDRIRKHGLQRMGTTDLRHEALFNPEEAISVLTKSDVADLVALMSDEELREYLTESVHPPAKLH